MSDHTPTEAEALTAAAGRLADEIEGRYVTKRAFYTVVVGVIVVIAGLIYLAVSNRLLFDDVHRQTDLLIECTTPTPDGDDDPHECFDDGQTRQQQAVAAIIDAIVSAIREGPATTPP